MAVGTSIVGVDDKAATPTQSGTAWACAPSAISKSAYGCAQVTYGALAAACEKAATWRAAIAILQHALQQDQTGTASHNQGPA